MPYKDPIKRKAYRREYFKREKDRAIELHKLWILNNPGKHNIYQKKYRDNNKALCRKRVSEWRKTDAGKISLRNAVKRYSQTINGKHKINRYKDIRRRDFERIAINGVVPGFHAHHLNKKFVVYIPAKIHRSISHNTRTGANIHEINTLALSCAELLDELQSHDLQSKGE
jgi:hypothetical protein